MRFISMAKSSSKFIGPPLKTGRMHGFTLVEIAIVLVIVGLMLVGMFLGWQSVLAVATMTLGAWLCCHAIFTRALRVRTVTPAVCLLLATVAHLLLWSRFYP